MNTAIGRLAASLIATVLFAAACTSAPGAPPTAAPPPATNTSVPTVTRPPNTSTPVPTPSATPYPVFWDDFDGEFLEGWTWIRENDALWSLVSEPGYLRIVLDSSRPPRNLLVREVGSPNFQIMTHVLFEPTSNYQFAGLLVYEDDDTTASLGRAYCNNPGTCVGNGIYFDASQDGQFLGTNFGIDTPIKDEAYLRIDRAGYSLKAYYSEDGANWTFLGEHVVTMLDPKVGLIAANSHVVGAVALFDYFTAMEMP
ncbi:MAG TPA: DUF1349 domain-containing protein [Anaerolineales bacterium]|nr:DUF1349 domain-containing protein [Anaerolineales bacterium]